MSERRLIGYRVKLYYKTSDKQWIGRRMKLPRDPMKKWEWFATEARKNSFLFSSRTAAFVALGAADLYKEHAKILRIYRKATNAK